MKDFSLEVLDKMPVEPMAIPEDSTFLRETMPRLSPVRMGVAVAMGRSLPEWWPWAAELIQAAGHGPEGLELYGLEEIPPEWAFRGKVAAGEAHDPAQYMGDIRTPCPSDPSVAPIVQEFSVDIEWYWLAPGALYQWGWGEEVRRVFYSQLVGKELRKAKEQGLVQL